VLAIILELLLFVLVFRTSDDLVIYAGNNLFDYGVSQQSGWKQNRAKTKGEGKRLVHKGKNLKLGVSLDCKPVLGSPARCQRERTSDNAVTSLWVGAVPMNWRTRASNPTQVSWA